MEKEARKAVDGGIQREEASIEQRQAWKPVCRGALMFVAWPARRDGVVAASWKAEKESPALTAIPFDAEAQTTWPPSRQCEHRC